MSENFNFKNKPRQWVKKITAILVVILIIISASIGAALAYQKIYEKKVYPGVYVENYHLGGMTESEVKSFIEIFNNRIAKEGIDFYFKNKKGEAQKFKLNVITADGSSIELVKLDSNHLASRAISKGRTKSFWPDMIQPFYYRLFSQQKLTVKVEIRDDFMDDLKDYLASFSDKPHNANIKIKTVYPLVYDIVDEQKGIYFDYDQAQKDLEKNLSVLSLLSAEVKQKEFLSDINKDDVKKIISKLSDMFFYGNLGLNYIDPQTKIRRDWAIAPDIYSEWIEVRKAENKDLVFALNKKAVDNYFNGLKIVIEREMLDAKFSVQGNRVNKFQTSRAGIKMDTEKTYKDLDQAFQQRNYKPEDLTKTVSIVIEVTEPKIKLADANNLGIKEIIGVGKSVFKNSHTNRIKNIGNAVKRLNGTLIKPDEIFSTNKYAGPYTSSSGYLPEEVIVGNKIKLEIGGGMCQIGTTMFRTAMNSAMPISQRYNHSLVVQYYADPVNGNPGTDATVYEPYVDFKFKNDTGNYLLLQTAINYETQELTFTLWGKSDGRKGYYSHPLVSEWFNPGDPIDQKVIELAPGEKKCQNSFVGARASFTYTRVTSSSKKIDRIFESYYRPLPKICMVGVEKSEYCGLEENAGKDECEGVDVSGGVSATSTVSKVEG